MSSAFASRSSSPSEAELKLKAEQQAEYVKQLWLFLTAVIGLLTVINWSRLLLRTLRASRAQKRRGDNSLESVYVTETVPFPSGATNGRLSLRRIPQAISSTFRVLAFRTTVPIGPSSVMSVSELTFIIGYVAALLVWLWVNSTFQIHWSFILVYDSNSVIIADDLDTFFFEDRAAHLASCQVPLIVALAGKNNIITCESIVDAS